VTDNFIIREPSLSLQRLYCHEYVLVLFI